jgi:hypothetical protein
VEVDVQSESELEERRSRLLERCAGERDALAFEVMCLRENLAMIDHGLERLRRMRSKTAIVGATAVLVWLVAGRRRLPVTRLGLLLGVAGSGLRRLRAARRRGARRTVIEPER